MNLEVGLCLTVLVKKQNCITLTLDDKNKVRLIFGNRNQIAKISMVKIRL